MQSQGHTSRSSDSAAGDMAVVQTALLFIHKTLPNIHVMPDFELGQGILNGFTS